MTNLFIARFDYKNPKFWVVILSVIIFLSVGIGIILNPSHELQGKQKIKMAEVWAEALKTRDGKPRYEIMSENMKEEFIKDQMRIAGEDWNLVIGGSSPWVASYDIEIIGNRGRITYNLEDSGGGKYEEIETIAFGIEDNKPVITESKHILAEWERAYYFASTAEMAMEVHNKALIESDYLAILSLLHDSDFEINGQEIWETIKIRDVKVISGDIRENKACYELELDIEDGGGSAFETGISPRWLWLVREDNGWYVEGLMTGGEPDETWWD